MYYNKRLNGEMLVYNCRVDWGEFCLFKFFKKTLRYNFLGESVH